MGFYCLGWWVLAAGGLVGFYCCGWWVFTAGGLVVFLLSAGGLVGTTADDGQAPGEEFPF